MAMRVLTISVIVLVAVIMGFSTIAPALQQAFAHDVTSPPTKPPGKTKCPEGFVKTGMGGRSTGEHPDHNFNGRICVKEICPGEPPGSACKDPIRIEIDDNIPVKVRKK